MHYYCAQVPTNLLQVHSNYSRKTKLHHSVFMSSVSLTYFFLLQSKGLSTLHIEFKVIQIKPMRINSNYLRPTRIGSLVGL